MKEFSFACQPKKCSNIKLENVIKQKKLRRMIISLPGSRIDGPPMVGEKDHNY